MNRDNNIILFLDRYKVETNNMERVNQVQPGHIFYPSISYLSAYRVEHERVEGGDVEVEDGEENGVERGHDPRQLPDPPPGEDPDVGVGLD